MSEFSNTPMMAGNEPEMTLIETWMAVVTQPKVETFEKIAAQPSASTGKAVLWIFIASLVASFASLVAQAASIGSQMGGWQQFLPPEVAHEIPMDIAPSAGLGFGAVICGTPVAAAFSVLMFLISTALIQWVAKLFGGTGSFEKLAYTFSAITVPYSVVSAVLTFVGIIPIIGILTGLLGFGLAIYVIVLEVMAIRAVNHLDTGKAIGSILLPGLVFGFFICCCFAIGAAAMGPMIGEVFDSINQSLGGF